MNESRELELLWVALAEERRVVAMKNEVIHSLRVAMNQLEAKCKRLEDTVVDLQNTNQGLSHSIAIAPDQHQIEVEDIKLYRPAKPEGTDSAPSTPRSLSFHQPPPHPSHDFSSELVNARATLQQRTDALHVVEFKLRKLLSHVATSIADDEIQHRRALEDHHDFLSQRLFRLMKDTRPRDRVFEEHTRASDTLADAVVEVKRSLSTRVMAFREDMLVVSGEIMSQVIRKSDHQHAQIKRFGFDRHMSHLNDLVATHYRLCEGEFERHCTTIRAASSASYFAQLTGRWVSWILNECPKWMSQKLLIQKADMRLDISNPAQSPSRPVITAEPGAEVAIEYRKRIRELEDRNSQKSRTILQQAGHIEALERRMKDLKPREALVTVQAPPAVSAASTFDATLLTTMFADAVELSHRCALESSGIARDAMNHALRLAPKLEIVHLKEMLDEPRTARNQVPLEEAIEIRVVSIKRQWITFASAHLCKTYELLCQSSLDGYSQALEMFLQFAPAQRTADAVRMQIAESSLSLIEAQRDQAMTVANWMHIEATSAVASLSGLVSRVSHALKGPEQKVQSAQAGVAIQELQEQQRLREMDKATQKSVAQFSSVCDSLLDNAARVHARLVESEHEIAVLKRTVAQQDASGAEFRDAAQRFALSHQLEMSMSDEALTMLHNQLKEERDVGTKCLRALGFATSQRNVAILQWQRDCQELLTSARAASMLADYTFHGALIAVEIAFQSLHRESVAQRTRQMPSAGEIAFLLLVVHAEFGSALFSAHSGLLDSAIELREALEELLTVKKQHQYEMIAASQELVHVSRSRRIESEAASLLSQHALELAAQSAIFASVSAKEIASGVLESVSQLFLRYGAVQRERARLVEQLQAAEGALAQLRDERESIQLDFVASQEYANSLSAAVQRLSNDMAVTQHENSTLQDALARRDAVATDLEHTTAVLQTLLSAEKSAHALAKNHEEALLQEVAAVRDALQSRENLLKQLELDLGKEKEAHRSTIRALSRQ